MWLLTGFGATDDPQTHSSQYLKYVEMFVINNAECNETYGGMMTESKMCTNTVGGRSTCHGKQNVVYLKFNYINIISF